MIELSFIQIIFLILFGVFVGVLGSVMGVGGGVFIVPFLTLVFHIPIKYAIAVSLVSIIATSSSVASVNVEKGLANVRLGTILEIPMAIGSIASTLIMIKMNSSVLQLLFGFMILPVAASMYIKSQKEKKKSVSEPKLEEHKDESKSIKYFDHSEGREISYSVKKIKTAFAFSFLGGTMSGLFGLGGGIVQVPVMNMICSVPMKAATATSNFMIGLSACASVLILFKEGYVLNEIAVFMVIGVVIGGVLGMKFLNKTKNHVLQAIFSFLLMIISLKMIWSVLK